MAEKKKIEILELLRFMSMTEVFLIHYLNDYIHSDTGLNIPMVTGQLGVAFFFMITSYLLTKTTVPIKSGFLKRKAVTLLPSYEFILIAIFIVSILKPSLFRTFDTSLINFIKSIFLIPYRTENVPFSCPMLPVAWTLSVQGIIYIGFWFINKILSNSLKTGMVLSFIIIFGCIYGYIDNYSSIITFTYCRFYMMYFAIGFLAAGIENMTKKMGGGITNVQISTPICIILLLFFLGISCIYKENLLFLCLCGVIFILFVVVCNDFKIPQWVMFLGTISYPFFLLHYPICKVVTRLLSLTRNPMAIIGLLMVCYIFTVGISYVYKRCVDIVICKIEKG